MCEALSVDLQRFHALSFKFGEFLSCSLKNLAGCRDYHKVELFGFQIVASLLQIFSTILIPIPGTTAQGQFYAENVVGDGSVKLAKRFKQCCKSNG